jgi:LmbE family N-acetylglucosaminyl deacetylase
MKRVIIGIFAHPDDESFMVAPTLIKEIHEGAEVHLITLTTGQHGTNPDGHTDLGAIRLEEWQRAGSLIGAKSLHALAYTDGALANKDIDMMVADITAIASTVLANHPESRIEFMSFDTNGITGHIDHIVASRAACLAFYRLKGVHPEHFTKLRLACLSRDYHPDKNLEWRYMEAGRSAKEIDETVDARAYHRQALQVIAAHHSQRADGASHINRYGSDLGINHFIVLT